MFSTLYSIIKLSMIQISIILPGCFLKTFVLRAPVAQSVATRAVNPGVVSSNPSSVNILSDVWQKSLWPASFDFHQWAVQQSMWKSSQLLGKYVVWCTIVGKPGITWLCELVSVRKSLFVMIQSSRPSLVVVYTMVTTTITIGRDFSNFNVWTYF